MRERARARVWACVSCPTLTATILFTRGERLEDIMADYTVEGVPTAEVLVSSKW